MAPFGIWLHQFEPSKLPIMLKTKHLSNCLTMQEIINSNCKTKQQTGLWLPSQVTIRSPIVTLGQTRNQELHALN